MLRCHPGTGGAPQLPARPGPGKALGADSVMSPVAANTLFKITGGPEESEAGAKVMTQLN